MRGCPQQALEGVIRLGQRCIAEWRRRVNRRIARLQQGFVAGGERRTERPQPGQEQVAARACAAALDEADVALRDAELQGEFELADPPCPAGPLQGVCDWQVGAGRVLIQPQTCRAAMTCQAIATVTHIAEYCWKRVGRDLDHVRDAILEALRRGLAAAARSPLMG